MFRALLFSILLLWTSTIRAQTQDFPLGWGNRDGTRVISVIGRNMNYPSYLDKVFYQSSTGNSPSYTFPDYGTVQYGLGSCVVGNKRMQWWVEYQIDGGSNRSSYTVNPETEFGTKTVTVLARNYRKTSCTGGGETTYQTVVTLTVKFEKPEWIGLDEIKTICNGVDKDFLLSDYFSVKENVNFFLDGNPITILNPSDLAPGFHQLKAEKLYDNGQYDPNYGSRPGVVAFTFDFQVLESAVIQVETFPADICQNAQIFTLKATPRGGTWSGAGVDANGNFNPEDANIGLNEITYSFTNPNGCISQKKIDITVKLPTEVTVQDMSVCSTDQPFELTVAQPGGGTYSGRGITNNIFDPSKALVGANPIRYTYTDAGGCTTVKDFYINILDAGSFKVGDDIVLCTQSAEINLNEKEDVYPQDGTIQWSGTGVVSGKYFDPQVAGVGLHTLTGTLYVPTSGCTYTKSFVAKVVNGVAADAGTDVIVCKNAADFQIKGGTPVGGTWSGDYVQGGVFSVAQAPIGDYFVYYTYNDGNCTTTDRKAISVVTPPSVNAGNDMEICYNSAPTKVPMASPSGGVWSADGAYFDPATGEVDPKKMKIGQNILTYTYADGTCTVADELIITVLLPPSVEAGEEVTICENATPLTLLGDPTGGSWTGPGITGDRFYANAAGVGDHTLTYTYQDPTTKCYNTDVKYITVVAAPTVNAGPSIIACKNQGSIRLTGALPLGGQWSGDYVTNSTFDVAAAPLGTHIVYYTYSDGTCTTVGQKVIQVIEAAPISAGPDMRICVGDDKFTVPAAFPSGGKWIAPFYEAATNTFNPVMMKIGENLAVYSFDDPSGCTVQDTVIITLNGRPAVNGMRDFTACLNEAEVALQATPTGGIWEGKGINNNQGSFFNPSLATAGTHTLTYTYLETETGCTTIDTVLATVYALPELKLPSDTAVCIESASFSLEALPKGGSWSGSTGINGSNFDPAVAGAGTHTLKYTYTDLLHSCTNSATISIIVKPVPGAIEIKGDTIACLNETVTLTASAENATEFDWYYENEASPFASGKTIQYKVTKNEKILIRPKIVSNGDCTTEGRIFNLVCNSPAGEVNYAGKDTLEFGGLYQATSSLSNTEKYSWAFGDGGTSEQKDANHYYYKPGKYEVVLIATSNTGCETEFKLDSLIVLTEKGEIPDPEFGRGNGFDDNEFKGKIYPTAFSNKLTATFTLRAPQEVTFTFYDQRGNEVQIIKRMGVAGSNKEVFTDLSFVRGNGVYVFVKISSNEFKGSYKLFKLGEE